MKVANFLVVHKNPGQLRRLVNQFDGTLFHNFVHVNKSCALSDFAELARLPHVTLLPERRKVIWAGYSFVAVCLDAFALITASKEPFSHISVMSGQDYPIKPTTKFYEFLQQSPDREFFQIADMEAWPQGVSRYEQYHLTDWTIKGRYRLEKWINKYLVPKRPFHNNLQPFGRSAWFSATADFARYALAYVRDNPGYVKFMKTVWNPDEFFFNTMVMNSPFRERVVHNNLRYIDWSDNNPNPKLLGMADLPALLRSDCFLARKFDACTDVVVLDHLDAHNSGTIAVQALPGAIH